MNYIELLKTNFFDKKAKTADANPAQDIALLAFMCKLCKPQIVKPWLKIFFQRYAYYVPRNNDDLDLAKHLFERNGVNVSVYFSHIMGGAGQNVLRLNYGKSKNYEHDKDFFEKIREKRLADFYHKITDAEKERLRSQYDLLRKQRLR